MPKHGQRVSSHKLESIEVLYVLAHVTEVLCYSISGFEQSYNYMCSGAYYFIIGHLVCHLRTRRGGEVRSNFSFTLPYKHVWTILYTYRVLISPIDESLEQQNKKTKPKHNIFHPVNSSFAVANPRSGYSSQLASPLQRGVPSPRRRTPDLAQIFYHFFHFFIN